MKVSYEGIGQWAATFACSGVGEGQVVKVSGSGTVGACAAGDRFCGTALAVSRDGSACTVALGGMVTAVYSGDTAPAVGWVNLTADGSGGVTVPASGGQSYLAVDVDSAAKTVTFVL